MKKVILLALAGLATAALLWAQNAADDWKEGDIVFQISKSQ